MSQPLKDAATVCKTIMRNGYDAYVINTVLQQAVLQETGGQEVEVATELDFDKLQKLFPSIEPADDSDAIGVLQEGESLVRFYLTNTLEASHVDSSVVKVTPRLIEKLEEREELPPTLVLPSLIGSGDAYEGFTDWDGGVIRLKGIPDETLKANFLLAFRTLRFAANFQLPIDPNTWMAVVRNAEACVDACPMREIMNEWRKVEAENLWRFAQLLFEARIMHELIPEVAALRRVSQIKNDNGEEEDILDHTFETMRQYSQTLPYDWYGAVACLLHDVGKLKTAEYLDGRWVFYQHHHVGAKLARTILRRLQFLAEDIDLICYLIWHHKRFDFMLTERGIRRFKALDEYPRLIEMARANIKASNGNYTAFNHNMKYLERADIPEEMTEPLLNGNQIMQQAGLKPGPAVGVIREALLKAQIVGEVTSVQEAEAFVRNFQAKEAL
jgi:poly(A) polymerase